jgi:hypothetical protein
MVHVIHCSFGDIAIWLRKRVYSSEKSLEPASYSLVISSKLNIINPKRVVVGVYLEPFKF